MDFVDTNVLIYSLSLHPDDAAKADRARTVIRTHELALSVQVLQEFYWQATHPQRRLRYGPEDGRRAVEGWIDLAAVAPAAMTVPILEAAMSTSARFQISYWDGAILEAAKSLGCDTVLTEDLSDAQDYDGVRVQNPFAGIA